MEIEFTEAELARQLVEESVEYLNGDFRVKLKDLIERYGEESFLDVEVYYDYSDTNVTIRILRFREETDEEYGSRIEKLRKRKEKSAVNKLSKAESLKAADRKKFDKLGKKYGW